MTNHPFEPSADMRQVAKSMWNLYQALMQEGFTEEQAMRIILAGASGGKSEE